MPSLSKRSFRRKFSICLCFLFIDSNDTLPGQNGTWLILLECGIVWLQGNDNYTFTQLPLDWMFMQANNYSPLRQNLHSWCYTNSSLCIDSSLRQITDDVFTRFASIPILFISPLPVYVFMSLSLSQSFRLFIYLSENVLISVSLPQSLRLFISLFPECLSVSSYPLFIPISPSFRLSLPLRPPRKPLYLILQLFVFHMAIE